MRFWAVGIPLLLLVVGLAGCSSTPDATQSTTTSHRTTSTSFCKVNPDACTGTQPSGTTTPQPPPPPDPGNPGTGGNETGPGGSGNVTPSPPRTWASPDAASIRPGVQVLAPLSASTSAQCTSNFLFTSPDNSTVYLGVAAHCVNFAADGTGTATDGCDRSNTPMPLGTKVTVEGAGDKGILAYTSWGTMQNLTETDGDTCAYNDFALIRLSGSDAASANPAMKQYGGPTALADPSSLRANDKVLTFGNSWLRQNEAQGKEGYVWSSSTWTTVIYTVSPGIEGDSGSAVILASGPAIGDLVTLNSVPPGASGITNLLPALAYAKEHAGIDVRLATWQVLNAGVLPPI